MFILLNWMLISGLSCIIHAELEMFCSDWRLFYLCACSMADPTWICVTLLCGSLSIPTASFISPGIFLGSRKVFGSFSELSPGSAVIQHRSWWGWREETRLKLGLQSWGNASTAWESERNLGRAAKNRRMHQKCLNRTQCHVWVWFCSLLVRTP